MHHVFRKQVNTKFSIKICSLMTGYENTIQATTKLVSFSSEVWSNGMKEKEEEHIVNSYGNFLTEVLMRSEIKEWLVWQITKSV